MRKVGIVILSIFMVMFSLSGNVSALDTVSNQNPTELKGILEFDDLEGGAYFLNGYLLTGNIQALTEHVGKEVLVKGSVMELQDTIIQKGSKAFSVSSFELIGGEQEEVETPSLPEQPEPTYPPVDPEKPELPKLPVKGTSFTGTVEVNMIEGKHYELKTQYGLFILTGNIAGIEKQVGKKVKVHGTVLKDAITIWQRGQVLSVTKWESLEKAQEPSIPYPDPIIPLPDPVKPELPKSVEVQGKVVVNYIEGKHFELNTSKGRYVLIGNTAGLEKVLNKTILVKGTVSPEQVSYYMRGTLLKVESWELKEVVISKPIVTKPVIPRPVVPKPIVKEPIKKPIIVRPVEPIVKVASKQPVTVEKEVVSKAPAYYSFLKESKSTSHFSVRTVEHVGFKIYH